MGDLTKFGIKAGDVIASVEGDGVHWPFDKFSYRVKSVSGDRIELEIVEPGSGDGVSNG